MLDALNARLQALLAAVDAALEAGDDDAAQIAADAVDVVCAEIDALQA